MPLVTLNKILLNAQENKYAVGAFNTSSLELAKAVVESAEEVRSPVIVNCHPSEIKYAGIAPLSAMIKALANTVSVPVVLHLDHGDSYETVIQCIRYGFTSVMYDGSSLSFDKNVQQTKAVVNAAKAVGVSVEAELGCIGGKEMDIRSHKDLLTDPDEAVHFIAETGIDALAVAIGTVHGLYQFEPNIDLERLEEIRSKVDVPLVLHGGSGTPETTIKQAIELGISKVNISTEMKLAFRNAIKEFVSINNDYEIHHINRVGVQAAKELVKSKMELFGSIGKV